MYGLQNYERGETVGSLAAIRPVSTKQPSEGPG